MNPKPQLDPFKPNPKAQVEAFGKAGTMDSKVPSIAAVWDNTQHIAGTPAQLYIHGRLGPIDIAHIPSYSLRWLPADKAPCWQDTDRSIVPHGAAGLLVAGYYRTCSDYIIDAGYINPPRAIELEALRPCGRRPRQRWRRTFHSPLGCAIEVWYRPERPSQRIIYAEGVASALAAAQLYATCQTTIALAVGSAHNLTHANIYAPSQVYSHQVIIASDGDDIGSKFAAEAASNYTHIHHRPSPEGKDPYDIYHDTILHP